MKQNPKRLICIAGAAAVLCGQLLSLDSARADSPAPSLSLTSTNVLTAGTADLQAEFRANEAAAKNGDAKALFELARAYDQGHGVAKDPDKAFESARLSSEKGYPPGEVMLGSFYGRGVGVTKDLAEAVRWYRKAADQGYALAQFAMGGFYKTGKGVPKDIEQALKWYRKAADQSDPAAECELGLIYFFGYKSDTNHPANYNESFKWLKKSADQGYVGAMNNLGLSYLYGYGVKMDTATGAMWVRKAAEEGNANAMDCLGQMYRDGSSVIHQDSVEAFVWLCLAARGGSSDGRHSARELGSTLSPAQLQQATDMLKYYDEHHTLNGAPVENMPSSNAVPATAATVKLQ